MNKFLNDYDNFLRSKMVMAKNTGFDIELNEINPLLKPHQKDIIQWCVRGGNRAIFASFGLGKSIMQIEVLRIIQKKFDGKCLIVCPLGVKHEFINDGLLKSDNWDKSAALQGLNIDSIRDEYSVDFQFVRRASEMDGGNFFITNYESIRDGKLDPNIFDVVSLDEASVLRGYGTKTYQEFLPLFKDVKYKFVATATPSPNKFKELIHYSGFLGIMDTGQSLTRFFQRDSTKANNLTLYPHKKNEFWLWLASWGLFITKPSDLGYDDDGYELPELKVHWHRVGTPHDDFQVDKFGQAKLVRDTNLSLPEASKEKRISLPNRIEKMTAILNDNKDENFILWHHQESERHAIKKAVPGAQSVYGSLDLDSREKIILDFANGKSKYLSTKPIISGSGCNFQRHCNNVVFLGIDHKFNDFIQAVHRIYRFLQDKECHVHIIYTENEDSIKKSILEKWEQHKELQQEMTGIIKKYGLSHEDIKTDLQRSIGVKRHNIKGENFDITLNDTVLESEDIDENSKDLIVTSIPFGNHYEYSASYNCFGHNETNNRFFEQLDFLTPNLHKMLKPGRVYACHVKDRINFGNVTGYGMPTVEPFHVHTIINTLKHGFVFFGMITIETDVVRENNQTYRLGWTEQCKDGTKMGVGSPEYVLLFRKLPTDTNTAYADMPVEKSKEDYTRGKWQIDARAKWNSSGDRFLTPQELSSISVEGTNKAFKEHMKNTIYNYNEHISVAESFEKAGKLPSTFETLKIPARYKYVWSDVNRMQTLNGQQSNKKLQNHICPLQFDIVDRLITRFSNPGEVVHDPFGGLMTVPNRAIKLGRKGSAVELNEQYFVDGSKYLFALEEKLNTPSLFDLEGFK